MQLTVKRHLGPLAIITAAALLLLGRQLTTPAIFCCIIDDTNYYVSWARQFHAALLEGIAYPRWLPDSNGGFGSPTFLFYAPLAMYLTALFEVLGGSLFAGVTGTKLAGLLASGVFLYRFVEVEWGRRAGVIAALLYMALPFRVYDLYVLGVFQSKLALAFFPLCLHAARAIAWGRRGGVMGLGVAYGLLTVTHLLSAYLMIPVVAVYVAMTSPAEHRAPRLALAALGGLLGLLLVGAYTLPMVVESSHVQLDSFFSKPTFHYQNNFLFTVLGDPSPFRPSFYPFAARTVSVSVLTGLTLWLLSRPLRGLLPMELPFVLVVLGSLFLMSSLSGFVWAVVPGLEMVAFPSRFAVLLVLALAILVGKGSSRLARLGPLELGLGALCALPTIALDLEIIQGECTFGPAELVTLDPDLDVEEYVPVGVSLPWLRDALERPTLPPVAAVGPTPITTDVHTWTSIRREVVIEVPEPTTVRVRTFAFPGWRATLDDATVALGREPKTGAMLVEVPPGRHTLTIVFGSTWDRTLGIVTSVLAILGCVLWTMRQRVSSTSQVNTNAPASDSEGSPSDGSTMPANGK